LAAQRDALIAESDKLAAELRSAEAIRRNAEILLGVERRGRSLEVGSGIILFPQQTVKN
jgi:hypothetical protein